MKKTKSKLSFDRTTIRTLTTDVLAGVAGGFAKTNACTAAGSGCASKYCVGDSADCTVDCSVDC